MNETVYSQFGEEEDFIDIAVLGLDGLQCGTTDQSAAIQVKEMHQSPYVTFDRPDWVRSTNPEMADLLYIVNIWDGTQIVERRASLSQAKFTKESDNEWESRRWKIQMHQYYFLHEQPEFCFNWKRADEDFEIEPENKSFVTYSFASDFLPPFFQPTKTMRRYMYETDTDPAEFSFPRKRPWVVEQYNSVLQKLVERQYGEAFERGDKIYKLFKYMFSEQRDSTFTSSRTKNEIVDDSDDIISDGGYEDPNSGLQVVFIDVSLDNGELDFRENSGEWPRQEYDDLYFE